MWNLKHNISECIYKTGTNSQTNKTNSWLPKGRGQIGTNLDYGIHTLHEKSNLKINFKKLKKYKFLNTTQIFLNFF